MRTTLELPDALLKRAQKLARARGVPFRALVVEALQHLLKVQASTQRYKLPDTTFGGDGLVEGLQNLEWGRLRPLVYDEGTNG